MDDRGDARVLYTSTNTPDFGIGRIRSAEPSDADWIHWRKGAIVAEAPDGLDLIAYRDPFVRREGDRWRMFVGAAGRDGTAMALTYVSEDQLETWRYDGVALARSTHETDPVWTGALWECPQIFAIADRYAMVYFRVGTTTTSTTRPTPSAHTRMADSRPTRGDGSPTDRATTHRRCSSTASSARA